MVNVTIVWLATTNAAKYSFKFFFAFPLNLIFIHYSVCEKKNNCNNAFFGAFKEYKMALHFNYDTLRITYIRCLEKSIQTVSIHLCSFCSYI